MSTRVKCLNCDHMILEVTARLNDGLCGICHASQSATQSKSLFDEIVQGWLDHPETLPGTNGIPLPKGIEFASAADRIRRRLYPTEMEKMEEVCRDFFNAAHNQWMANGSSSLSMKQKHSLATETFHGEVRNGGLIQYLDNESGAFANWAADGFDSIGIPQYAEIMRKVQALFPDSTIPEDPDERSKRVEEFEASVLEEIEQPFWDRYFENENESLEKMYDYLTGKA